jgi:hypothetical protein
VALCRLAARICDVVLPREENRSAYKEEGYKQTCFIIFFFLTSRPFVLTFTLTQSLHLQQTHLAIININNGFFQPFELCELAKG